MNPFKLE